MYTSDGLGFRIVKCGNITSKNNHYTNNCIRSIKSNNLTTPAVQTICMCLMGLTLNHPRAYSYNGPKHWNFSHYGWRSSI